MGFRVILLHNFMNKCNVEIDFDIVRNNFDKS